MLRVTALDVVYTSIGQGLNNPTLQGIMFQQGQRDNLDLGPTPNIGLLNSHSPLWASVLLTVKWGARGRDL